MGVLINNNEKRRISSALLLYPDVVHKAAIVNGSEQEGGWLSPKGFESSLDFMGNP